MAINVSDNNPRINYTATSGQTVFTVPFEFFASTDLTVYVGGSVLSASAYTVTGGSGSTGSITTDSGQTAGAEIAIVRDVPLERTTDLTSSYSASSLNDQLDRIVTQVADLDDRVSRSISLNDYEVGVSLDLPAKASRLGKTVQFNSTTGALEIGPSGNELTSIASIASEITSLNGIKANITTVAGAISNINSVGSNISSVTSVASSISNVNTVNTNIANVNSVATSITDVNDVADSIDQVELVAGSISNVDIVGPAIANVNTVAGNISNINTVAAISANVTTVAGITAAISTVNSNATNINLAATNIDDVNDVANVITKVTTVADNIANVNTVAPSVSYLSTVANNISNINTLAPISADITTVAGVASSVSGAAANAAAAEAAKVAAQAAQAAAELAADNFDDTYLGAKASDPTLDNDGDSLGNGDLYFNTTDGTLKVYNNSAWQAAALDASGFVDVTGDSMTGNLLFGDGNSARFGTHGDLTLVHETNNSYIIASNSKPFTIRSDDTYFRDNANSNLYMDMISSGGVDYRVRLYHSGTDVRLETTSTGIDVTGTVTADGLTVDGDAKISSGSPTLRITETDTTDVNTRITAGSGNLYIQTENDAENSRTDRFRIAHSTGDISFYEDTGTTPKFFWDASAESLGIGTTSPVTSISANSQGLAIQHSNVPFISLEHTGASGKRYSLYSNSAGALVTYDEDAVSTRMIIDSSGNLLVGATSSTGGGRLELKGSGTGAYVPTGYNGNNVNSVRIVSGGSPSTSDTVGISMGIGGGAEGYFGIVQDSSGYANFVFNSYNGSYAERMRIDSSGNVGIGIDSPTAPLHVQVAGSGEIARFRDNGSNAVVDVAIVNDSQTWALRVDGASSDSFHIRNSQNSTNPFTIDTSGNVGIGCSASTKLEIDQGSSSTASFKITGSSSPGMQIVESSGVTGHFVNDSAAVYIGSSTNHPFVLRTNNTPRMSIDSSGNVGIGTDSPSSYLATKLVISCADEQGITLAATSSSHKQNIYFADGTSGSARNRGNVSYDHNLDQLSMGTASGSLRLVLDGSGNLIVGDTSAGGVTSGGKFYATPLSGIYAAANADNAGYFNRNGGDGSIVEFRAGNAPVGSIGSEGSDSLYIQSGTTSGTGLHFTSNGTTIRPARNGVTVDATLDLGSDTRRFKDLYLSGGVYLGGAVAANKLDDYEEGEHTITVNQGGFSLNSSYTNWRYTKIGRMVHIEGLMLASSAGNDAAEVKINLPFAYLSKTSSQSDLIVQTVATYRAPTGDAGLKGVITNSTSHLQFKKTRADDTWISLAGNEIASGDHIYVNLWYPTA